jgi:hypothetical protein
MNRRESFKAMGRLAAAGAVASSIPSLSASAAGAGASVVCDVCIIGGGSAGTYAALGLSKAGLSVVVLERTSQLGGHTQTYVDPVTQIPIDYGVQEFENKPLVTDYLNSLNVPFQEVPQFPSTILYGDFQTGNLVNYTPPAQQDVAAALITYQQILVNVYPYLDAGYDLPDPVPTELLQPFGNFVVKYGLEALVPLIFEYDQGIARFLAAPTLYVLKQFSLSVVSAILGPGFLFVPAGNSLIYENAARVLGTSVIYNATIGHVNRNDQGVHVTATTPNGLVNVHCDKLVVACPPTLQNLAPFDLTDLEKSLFSRFRPNCYATGLVQLNANTGGVIQNGVTLENVSPTGPYNLPSLPGIYLISPTAAPGVWHVFYGAPTPQADDAIQAEIQTEINRFTPNGAQPVFQSFRIFSNHTPYEIEVTANDIANGFYTAINALQGQNRTFYTGATFQINDSSLIWQFTASLLPKILA